MSNCRANSASVLSPLTAARATFALKAGVWFRRGRLVIVSPGLQPFWLLSGRNSTYPDVQISKASSVCSKPHPWPSIQGCGPVVALSGLGARTQQGDPAPSYSQSGLSRSGLPFPTRPSHALPTARHVEKMITNIFAADCHTSGIALRRNPNQRSGGTDSAGSRNSLQDRVWLRPFGTYPHMVRGHSWSPPHTGKWPPAAEPAPVALVDRQQ